MPDGIGAGLLCPSSLLAFSFFVSPNPYSVRKAHHQIQYRTDVNLVHHTIRVIHEIFFRDELFLSAETWHLSSRSL